VGRLPALHCNVQAHQEALPGPCRDGLECVPLPRRGRWSAQGRAKRHVPARQLYRRSSCGTEGAGWPPSPVSEYLGKDL